MAMKAGDDPKDYSVDEVNTHLDSADEEETKRVRSAEAGGKNRKGIVGDGAEAGEAEEELDSSGRVIGELETDPVAAAEATLSDSQAEGVSAGNLDAAYAAGEVSDEELAKARREGSSDAGDTGLGGGDSSATNPPDTTTTTA